MKAEDRIEQLMYEGRLHGIAVIIGLDGRLKAFPSAAARKHQQFLLDCGLHTEGIKRWLRNLARLT